MQKKVFNPGVSSHNTVHACPLFFCSCTIFSFSYSLFAIKKSYLVKRNQAKLIPSNLKATGIKISGDGASARALKLNTRDVPLRVGFFYLVSCTRSVKIRCLRNIESLIHEVYVYIDIFSEKFEEKEENL